MPSKNQPLKIAALFFPPFRWVQQNRQNFFFPQIFLSLCKQKNTSVVIFFLYFTHKLQLIIIAFQLPVPNIFLLFLDMSVEVLSFYTISCYTIWIVQQTGGSFSSLSLRNSHHPLNLTGNTLHVLWLYARKEKSKMTIRKCRRQNYETLLNVIKLGGKHRVLLNTSTNQLASFWSIYGLDLCII